MATILYPLLSVVLVSLISFAGLFTISLKEEILKKYVFILVSLAVGALLGDAFIHLIPEALEIADNASYVSIGVIGGILFFFVLEKFLHWHHHSLSDEEKHIHPVGKMILVSDGAHNFIDGLIIATSYTISVEVGIATTLAVILHEIPQEIGDFGVLIHAGYTKSKALFQNFLSALMAIAGVILAFLLNKSGETLVEWLIPIAAGGFIYIALSDLTPELHKTESKYFFAQFLAILAGAGAMFLLLFLE